MSRIHTTAQWIKVRTSIENKPEFLVDPIRTFLETVLKMKFYGEKVTKFIVSTVEILGCSQPEKLPNDLGSDLTHHDWLEFRDLMGSLYCIVN